MRIATITSAVLPRFDGSAMQMGSYEMPVDVDLQAATASGDPLNYLKHEIALHLEKCVKSTGFPIGERIWEVSFTPAAMQKFGFPARFVA